MEFVYNVQELCSKQSQIAFRFYVCKQNLVWTLSEHQTQEQGYDN